MPAPARPRCSPARGRSRRRRAGAWPGSPLRRLRCERSPPEAGIESETLQLLPRPQRRRRRGTAHEEGREGDARRLREDRARGRRRVARLHRPGPRPAPHRERAPHPARGAGGRCEAARCGRCGQALRAAPGRRHADRGMDEIMRQRDPGVEGGGRGESRGRDRARVREARRQRRRGEARPTSPARWPPAGSRSRRKTARARA